MINTKYPLALFVEYYGTDQTGKAKTDILTLEWLATQAKVNLDSLDVTDRTILLETIVQPHYKWNNRYQIGIYQYATIHWLEKIEFSEEFKDSIWK
jgi:hypothetical protein